MPRLRVSAISYLNTAPLMWDFDHGQPPVSSPEKRTSGDFDVSYTIPSACAENLRTGAADIGIIPAVTYATIPGLLILPDVVIASKGPVRSILLVSRKPLDEIRTVAADTSSRSSVALAEVLFRKFLGGTREFIPMPPDLDAMLGRCDAALLIGDPALRLQIALSHNSSHGYFLFDLAELWKQHTGQAFVFAFWAVRASALDQVREGLNVSETFRNSAQQGLKPENLRRIARAWSPHVDISEAEISHYLTENIHYDFDRECHTGVKLFLQYATECGVIPKVPELRFYSPVELLSR